MANRGFEVFQYRQVIHRIRMGESDQEIAKSGLLGKLKCSQVRAIAEGGWLNKDAPLPNDADLTAVFAAGKAINSTHVP